MENEAAARCTCLAIALHTHNHAPLDQNGTGQEGAPSSK